MKYLLKKSEKVYSSSLEAYNILYEENKDKKKFEVKEDD